MSEHVPQMKPVPSLAQWLGDGARGDGFEEWVSLSLDQTPDLPPDQARFLRIAQTFAVACIETMRRETGDVPGADQIGVAMAQWARAAGYVSITAAASVLVPDAPWRRLGKIWAEEFQRGARMAADSLAREARRAQGGGDA